jgi:hypothetical protein
MLDHDLRRAQDMTGRGKPQRHLAELDRLAVGERAMDGAGTIPKPEPHDGQRLRRRQHLAVAGPGMVAVAVADDRARYRAQGVDEEAAGTDVQPLRTDLQPLSRMQP